jgi:hypothetical protein
VVPRHDGQRLERSETATGGGAGAAGLVAAADSEGHSHSPGGGERTCERRGAGTLAGGSPAVWPPKPTTSEGVSTLTTS